MKTDSTQLLKRLEPAVRPVAPPADNSREMRAVRGFEAQRFEDMLSLVARGSVHSGRCVECDFEPAAPLTDDQLARLSAGADLAEAAGARRALMLIDGRSLVLEVEPRQLVEELASSGESRVLEINAAVHVAGDDDSDAKTIPPPGRGLIPRAVAAQLAERAASAASNPR